MSRANKEGVLSRWSRLKRESAPAANEAEASPDQLAAEADNELEEAGEADPFQQFDVANLLFRIERVHSLTTIRGFQALS